MDRSIFSLSWKIGCLTFHFIEHISSLLSVEVEENVMTEAPNQTKPNLTGHWSKLMQTLAMAMADWAVAPGIVVIALSACVISLYG